MKEFKDYSSDNSFPINRDQTFAPVYRAFNDNLITRCGVFFAEFLYPPFVIEDVVGKPRIEPKANLTPFLLGLFILLSILFGILFGIRWYLLYRQRKRLSKIPFYFGENRQAQNLIPPKLIYNEHEFSTESFVLEPQDEPIPPCLAAMENIERDEAVQPIIDPVPNEVVENAESAMRVACDNEMDAVNIVDNKIMPCETAENIKPTGTEPVAPPERVVRKRFARQPLDRKLGTPNTETMPRKPIIRKPNLPEPVSPKIKLQSSLKTPNSKSPARK